MKLHLIRHAESTGNYENILQGHRDYPLTSQGVIQARYLRDLIYENYNNYDVVFTSTSIRALNTARLSQDNSCIDLDELREIDFGSLSGKKISTKKEKKMWADIFTDPNYKGHGGESVNEFGNRVTKVLMSINRYMIDYECSEALVYTHMGVIKAIFKGLLDKEIDLDNTGIISIEIKSDDGKLICKEVHNTLISSSHLMKVSA